MSLRDDLVAISLLAVEETAVVVERPQKQVVVDQSNRAQSIIAVLPGALKEAAQRPGFRRCTVMPLDADIDFPGSLSGHDFTGLIDQFSWKGWRDILEGAALRVAEFLDSEGAGVGILRIEKSGSDGTGSYEVWLTASW